MLVSVIIPCYNVQDYIVECIDSVLSQTHKEYEILCIDNNSSDFTWAKLIDLKTKYPQIIINKEMRPGANAARNKGVSLSNGEWIQFLDADDLLLPNKIKHQIELILNNEKESIAFIAASHIKRNVFNKERKELSIEKNKYLAPFINQCGNTCSNLWNKKALCEVEGWNESNKSSQETDLMFRLILANKSYIIDELPLTIIRERKSGQISQRNPSEKWIQYIDVRLNYINELKKDQENTYNEIKGILYDFLMVSVLILAKYDLKIAMQYYNTFIKNNWVSSNQFGFSKIKVFIIKFFGLKTFITINSLLNNNYVK